MESPHSSAPLLENAYHHRGISSLTSGLAADRRARRYRCLMKKQLFIHIDSIIPVQEFCNKPQIRSGSGSTLTFLKTFVFMTQTEMPGWL